MQLGSYNKPQTPTVLSEGKPARQNRNDLNGTGYGVVLPDSFLEFMI